jgi:hypothetical protein
MAGAAGVLAMRQSRYRHGRERSQAVKPWLLLLTEKAMALAFHVIADRLEHPLVVSN